MNTQDNDIDIFALTDSHQETRKLCCLFSGIMEKANPKGAQTLICDCGDLLKGIYDRQLSVDSYLKFREVLPEAKIVMAIGNNDFGFNQEQFAFLQKMSARFNQANIHMVCANLRDIETNTYPKWVDPYILLNIGGKRVLVTAFCMNQVQLRHCDVRLTDIPRAFLELQNVIKHIAPDVFIVMNHALEPSSRRIMSMAEQCGIRIDLLIGGHEHSPVEPDTVQRIYYPKAFNRSMWFFKMHVSTGGTSLDYAEEIDGKSFIINKIYEESIVKYEEKSGLNIPVAKSILNLERSYSNPSPLGTFIADIMRDAAHATIGMISTGYMSHALRYEKDKILTYYNVERAFSAYAPLQTVAVHPQELKIVFENALRNRYTQYHGNTRFLQCSQNVAVSCFCGEKNEGKVKQIYINGDALFDDNDNPFYPDNLIVCAVDSFIASGAQGYDVLQSLGKETIMRDNQMVLIKDLFIQAIKNAEKKYAPGTNYPAFKLMDLSGDEKTSSGD